MTIEYCRTAYPAELVRDHTPALHIDDIKDILTIRPMGWVLNEADIELLSTLTSPLQFHLNEYERSPSSQKLFDIINQ